MEQTTDDSPSYFNTKEAEAIADYIHTMSTKWKTSKDEFDTSTVCVVTYYKAQVKLIRQLLRQKQLSVVRVESVNNIQGLEFEHFIISTVRTYQQSVFDDECFNTDMGFLTNTKLLNTALTRPKYSLTVFGDPVCLCLIGKCKTAWSFFIDTCFQNKTYFATDKTFQQVVSLITSFRKAETENESNSSYNENVDKYASPFEMNSDEDDITADEIAKLEAQEKEKLTKLREQKQSKDSNKNVQSQLRKVLLPDENPCLANEERGDDKISQGMISKQSPEKPENMPNSSTVKTPAKSSKANAETTNSTNTDSNPNMINDINHHATMQQTTPVPNQPVNLQRPLYFPHVYPFIPAYQMANNGIFHHQNVMFRPIIPVANQHYNTHLFPHVAPNHSVIPNHSNHNVHQPTNTIPSSIYRTHAHLPFPSANSIQDLHVKYEFLRCIVVALGLMDQNVISLQLLNQHNQIEELEGKLFYADLKFVYDKTKSIDSKLNELFLPLENIIALDKDENKESTRDTFKSFFSLIHDLNMQLIEGPQENEKVVKLCAYLLSLINYFLRYFQECSSPTLIKFIRSQIDQVILYSKQLIDESPVAENTPINESNFQVLSANQESPKSDTCIKEYETSQQRKLAERMPSPFPTFYLLSEETKMVPSYSAYSEEQFNKDGVFEGIIAYKKVDIMGGRENALHGVVAISDGKRLNKKFDIFGYCNNNRALPGDKVQVEPTVQSNKQATVSRGRVVKTVFRHSLNKTFACRPVKQLEHAILVCVDNQWGPLILVEPPKILLDKYTVQIIDWPLDSKFPIGKII